jgi:hypothetical protein
MSTTTDKARTARAPRTPARKAVGWRAKTATMLGQVNCIIQGILDLNSAGMWAETEMLLDRAQTVHAGMASMIASTDPSRDDVRDESYELIALLRGAKALAKSEDVPDVLSDALDTAIGLLNAASGGDNPYLDGPRDDDDTSASPLKVVQAVPPEPEPEPAITKDTALSQGGRVAFDQMRRCTMEVAALAVAIRNVADASMASGTLDDCDEGYMLRAAAVRIHQLNSLLMSYFCEDTVTLDDASWALDRDHEHHELRSELSKEGEQQ